MRAAGEREVSDRALLLGLAAVVVPVLAIFIWATLNKGVWFDELWSKWMASRELPLAAAAEKRWFHDVHPPFFYLFHWSVSALVGPAVVTHRWLNLLWLAALGGIGAWVAAVRPARRPALVVGGLLLLSNTDFNKFAEYRSYAMVICASAALMLLLEEMRSRAADLGWRSDRGLALLLAVTIVFALNLHYISTLICGTAIGIFAGEAALQQRWRWVTLLIGVAAAAMLPLLGGLLAERSYMQQAVPDFWVDTGPFQAFAMMAGKLALATGLNIVVIGVVALAAARRFGIGGARPLTPAERADWDYARVAAIAFVTACTLLFLANLVRPVVVPRYLNALSPITIAIVAAIVADEIVARRRLYLLFLVNAALVAGFLAWSVKNRPSWDSGARLIATAIKACPTTAVYSMWGKNGLPTANTASLPNEEEFIQWAMVDLASVYRFPMRYIGAGGGSPPAPGGCPALLWIEQTPGLDAMRTARVAGLIGRAGPGHVAARYTGTGIVIVVTPPR